MPEKEITKTKDSRGNILVDVGHEITWRTLNGKIHTGTIIEMDSNVAIVETPDGERMSVEL